MKMKYTQKEMDECQEKYNQQRNAKIAVMEREYNYKLLVQATSVT